MTFCPQVMLWLGVAGFTLVDSAVSPKFSFGNMAHIRQSRPDSGLGFRVRLLKLYPDEMVWVGR